jgi:hypothetical protein
MPPELNPNYCVGDPEQGDSVCKKKCRVTQVGLGAAGLNALSTENCRCGHPFGAHPPGTQPVAVRAVYVQQVVSNVAEGNVFSVDMTPTHNFDIDHLKDAIKAKMAPDLDGIAAPKLTIYAPDGAHGGVEVVLPGDVKKNFKKVTKQSTDAPVEERGDVEVLLLHDLEVLPGGVKKKYKKVTDPKEELRANDGKNDPPYLFELPSSTRSSTPCPTPQGARGGVDSTIGAVDDGSADCEMVEPLDQRPTPATGAWLTPKFRFEEEIASAIGCPQFQWGMFRAERRSEESRDSIALLFWGPSGRGKSFAARYEVANALKNKMKSEHTEQPTVVVASATLRKPSFLNKIANIDDRNHRAVEIAFRHLTRCGVAEQANIDATLILIIDECHLDVALCRGLCANLKELRAGIRNHGWGAFVLVLAGFVFEN